MEAQSRNCRPFAGVIGFYHGLWGNATGIQLLLSVCFATFFPPSFGVRQPESADWYHGTTAEILFCFFA
jgi:hypothetical protein